MATSTPASASERLSEKQLFRQLCYVNGQWVGADDGQTINVDDPATGAVIGAVPRLGRAAASRAIDAAAAAYPDWRARTGKERAVLLRRWFELIMAHQEDLAILMTL